MFVGFYKQEVRSVHSVASVTYFQSFLRDSVLTFLQDIYVSMCRRVKVITHEDKHSKFSFSQRSTILQNLTE